MGHKLKVTERRDVERLLPRWLDAETRALVAELVVTLAGACPDLLTVLLYGSIARHDERPLDDPQPSDVDLLAIFATDDEDVTAHQGLAVSQALGPAYEQHLAAPRDVQVMLASRTLAEWDPTFVANVARDGKVLFTRRGWPLELGTASRMSAAGHRA